MEVLARKRLDENGDVITLLVEATRRALTMPGNGDEAQTTGTRYAQVIEGTLGVSHLPLWHGN